VWGAYGVTLLCLALEIFFVLRKRETKT
jgi:heme exporter protein CcmD